MRDLHDTTSKVRDFCVERAWFAADELNDPGRSDFETYRNARANGFELAPVAEADVVRAEAALKMPIPEPLRTLLTEVANGQFGPGYGLFGVPTASETPSLNMLAHHARGQGEGWWPLSAVPICYWGCDQFTALDSRSGELNRVCTDSQSRYREQHATLDAWLYAWMRGDDLWSAVEPEALAD